MLAGQFLWESSFNLWHGDKLVEFLNREYGFYEGLNGDGDGIMELPIQALEKAFFIEYSLLLFIYP